MRINEVCKECGLTKKAVEYYIEQGLISPDIMENGYRDFSQDDVEQLKKISVLRKLGLAVLDIRKALNDHSGIALHSVSQLKDLEIENLKLRQELTQKLAQDGNWEGGLPGHVWNEYASDRAVRRRRAMMEEKQTGDRDMTEETGLRRMEAVCGDAVHVQERFLKGLLSRNAQTEYGKKCGFSGLRTVEDYQKQVPLSRYDDYEPLIERQIGGERGLLTVDEPVFYEIGVLATSDRRGADRRRRRDRLGLYR